LHLKGQTQNDAFLLTLKSDNFNMLYKISVGYFELKLHTHTHSGENKTYFTYHLKGEL